MPPNLQPTTRSCPPDIAPEPPTRRQLRTFLAPEWRRFRRPLLALLLLALAGWAAGVAAPWLQRRFIDALNTRGASGAVWWYLALAAGCSTVTAGATNLTVWFNLRLQGRVAASLKGRVLSRLLDLPGNFFLNHPSGYLAGRIETDVNAMRFFYTSPRWVFPVESMKLATGMLMLLYIDWRIGAAAVLITLPYYLTIRHFRHRNYRLGCAAVEEQARNSSALQQLFGNMQLVKSNAGEAGEKQRISAQFHRTADVFQRLADLNSLVTMLARSIPALSRLLLLVVGVAMIDRGHWSLGELWALVSYLGLVFSPLQSIVANRMQRDHALAAAGRVIELYRKLPEENLEAGRRADQLHGTIELRALSFRHDPDQPLLEGVDCLIEAGEHVAITGPSGSGKSTLASLLLRFYVPDSGAILYDGIPAEAYHLRSLRQRLGFVSQRVQFLPGTLADNLRLGAPQATDEELRNAMCRAGAGPLLERLPQGLATPILEQGDNFSGGEKLRIAVARELLRNTAIILFDEPTANLDEVNEAILLNLLDCALSDRTVIMISHRPETLNHFPRVLHLEELNHYEKPSVTKRNPT